MKYVPPYGLETINPDAPYINGDPSIGRQGSIPPAAAFEHPMRELVGVVDKSKFIPTDTDLLQVAKGVRSQRLNYAEDTGSVNTLSVAYDPPITEYTMGLLLRVRVHATNTGGATIDAGAGVRGIKRTDGVPVAQGDLPAGGIVDLAYDGTFFQLINFFGRTVVEIDPDPDPEPPVFVPFGEDTSADPNLVVVSIPLFPTPASGSLMLVRINSGWPGSGQPANTGPTRIQLTGVAAYAETNVTARGSTSVAAMLLPGDINHGDVVLLCFDGVNWQVSPNILIPTNAIINIPNQFATVKECMNALARKRIAQTATLTIGLATGIYKPFAVFHSDGSRIVVQGTMIAATPVITDIIRTGSTPTARSNDTTTNLLMLRGRYGTEIRVERTRDMAAPDNIQPGYAVGVTNIGAGQPTFRDLLITGDRAPGELGYGTAPAIDEVGVFVGQSGALKVINVACCLLGTGFAGFSNADLVALNTISIGNSYAGYFSFKAGAVDAVPGWAFSNGYVGVSVMNNAHCGFQGYSQCNNSYGMIALSSADIGATQANILNNGILDVSAAIGSKIGFEYPVIFDGNKTSPFYNVVGNNNAIIMLNWTP